MRLKIAKEERTMNKHFKADLRCHGGDAGERARRGVGTHQARRDRGGGRRRRRFRPDGTHDAGRYPEEQPDETADDRVAQGRRVGRRGADVHEVQRRRPQQGAHRLFADLHAAACRQDSVQLAGPDAGVGDCDGRVRAVGQHDASVQVREGIRGCGQGRRPAVQDGRHGLQARGSCADGVHGEKDRREVRVPPV